MSLQTETLVDVLLARIAEDESAARAAAAGGRWRYEDGDSVGAWTLYDEHWRIADLTTYRHDKYDYAERMPAFRPPHYVDADANGAHIARWDPARVLAECDAKRRIVERLGSYLSSEHDPEPEGAWKLLDDHAWATLYDLALPYADHPDYRDVWRP